MGEDARNNTRNTRSDSPSLLSQHFTLILHATWDHWAGEGILWLFRSGQFYWLNACFYRETSTINIYLLTLSTSTVDLGDKILFIVCYHARTKSPAIARLYCVNCLVIFQWCANWELIGLCLDPQTEGGERAGTGRIQLCRVKRINGEICTAPTATGR